MQVKIRPSIARGIAQAPPSKSMAHRYLIAAALSNGESIVSGVEYSQDILATIDCLRALGVEITCDEDRVILNSTGRLIPTGELDCRESGSTLRFLLPVAGALGVDVRFRMHGRLPERPIFPLDRELTRGGCVLDHPEADVLRICGKLRPGAYELPGNVSSQYISGMLFALTLLDEESTLTVSGKLESAGYIDMTLKSMAAFGASPERTGTSYAIPGLGRYASPGSMQIGGDWSNAAFWLCADAISGCSVSMTGLDRDSAQGDRRIVDEIEKLRCAGTGSAIIDAADIPDLVPILAACCCARGQDARFIHAERLRIKESDRLASVSRALNALGAHVEETADGLIVDGARGLHGGEVDACGDHRIAMMAAIASCGCSTEVIVHGAQAVNKSYPGFWVDFNALGGCAELVKED